MFKIHVVDPKNGDLLIMTVEVSGMVLNDLNFAAYIYMGVYGWTIKFDDFSKWCSYVN